MDRKELTPEQIKTAVAWWKGAIRTPKFDNGDDSQIGGMGMMMGLLLASSHDPTEQEIEAFGEHLVIALTGATEWDNLDVDYHPNHFLVTATQYSGIHESRFPWKTTMWFRNGGVQVSHGYRAEVRELLLTEG